LARILVYEQLMQLLWLDYRSANQFGTPILRRLMYQVILDGILLNMASRFWVGGTGNWDASTTTHWSASTGGVGGSTVPTSADDVFLDGSSGAGTVTMTATANVNSLNCTSYTGTLVQGNFGLLIGSSTPGASNIALKLVSGMTYTPPTLTNQIQFLSTSATVQTIDFGSQQTADVNINGAGGSWRLVSGHTQNATTRTFFLTNGTIDTNDQTCSWGIFSSNVSNTRTLTPGASNINITGLTGTLWDVTTATNFTLTANTSTITFTGISSSTKTFSGGGKTYNILSYTAVGATGALVISGANTFNTLNVGSGRVLTLPSSTITTVSNWNVTGVVNGYLYLPAGNVAGNYISSPSAAALNITSDIDLVAYIAPDSWTPTYANSDMAIISKYDNTTNQRSYYFTLKTSASGASSGKLGLILSTTGSTSATQALSSVTPGFTDGTGYWVRVTWRASDGRVQFFTSNDVSTTAPGSVIWTQLGTNQSIVIASIFTGTAELEIGASAQGTASTYFVGKVYRAAVYNGIAGTLAFDANFATHNVSTANWSNAAKTTFAEGSANAATVTINGSIGQAGDGRLIVNSSISGTAATLTKAGGGIVNVNYLSIKDITVTPSTMTVATLFKQTNKVGAGTLSFVGVIVRAGSRVLTGTLSFVATIAKRIGYPLAGTLTFVGNLLKSPRRLLTGTVSFVGNTAKRENKVVSGTVSFIGSIARREGKALTGTLSFVGSLAKRSAKVLTGTLNFVVSFAKRGRRALSGALSFVGTLRHYNIFHVMTGTLSFIGNLRKSSPKMLTGTLSFIGNAPKKTIKALTATLTFVGSWSRYMRPDYINMLTTIVSGKKTTDITSGDTIENVTSGSTDQDVNTGSTNQDVTTGSTDTTVTSGRKNTEI
jgi:hypothetical protein